MQGKQNTSPIRMAISQRAYIQPGYHQNLSGSDTDVSTSTENLTAEEKSVLRNGIRQEPQGEETIISDADAQLMNTLIIHNNRLSGENNSLFYGQVSGGKTPSQHFHSPPCKDSSNPSPVTSKLDNSSFYSSHSENCNSQPTSPKDNVPSSPNSAHLKPMFSNLHKPPFHGSMQQFPSSDFPVHLNQNISHLLGPTSQTFYPLIPTHCGGEHSMQGIRDIPKHYLDQSEILKHLTKEMTNGPQTSPNNCRLQTTPPEYPKWQTSDYSKVMESNLGHCLQLDRMSSFGNTGMKMAGRFQVSRSHPDLTHLDSSFHSDEKCAKLSTFVPRSELRARTSDLVSPHATQIVDLLCAENEALKHELDVYYKKVSKLQTFEMEIQKVHQAHEDVVRSTEKREKLEKMIRVRMEMEIRRLQEQNREFRDYLDSSASSSSRRILHDINDSEVRKELSKREVLIAQLLTQNKELLAEKERQEIELQAQRATLQEQRNHIDILDSALTNAQTNVVKLEDESRKKQAYVERVSQLQKALTSLQQSSERRLQMEKKVRLQLEKEVEELRQKKGGRQEFPTAKDENHNNESLKKTVLEYEKKIIGLEAEVSKWEQRYIEESTMRQIAVDAASVPKDAKIAALERTSQESEKLIAQARLEKLKQMDELYASNRKCTELEGRIKDFESKLAEKDAMIRVLQQHSQSKDAVLQHAVLGRPPRHTRAASAMGLTTTTSHSNTSSGTSSRLGASGSLLSISSESSSTVSPSDSSPVTDSVTGSKKSLDEQLKELDSRLSSKDSIISALRAEKERYPSHFWRV